MIFIAKDTRSVDVYLEVTDKSYAVRNGLFLQRNNNLISVSYIQDISHLSVCAAVYYGYVHMPSDKLQHPPHISVISADSSC